MSTACECDACGDLFKVAIGTASIAVFMTTQIQNGDPVQEQTEADLCPGCTEKVIAVLKEIGIEV